MYKEKVYWGFHTSWVSHFPRYFFAFFLRNIEKYAIMA